MPSIGNSFAYELHLFDRFCISQRVTKVRRNVIPVVHAISQCTDVHIFYVCYGPPPVLVWCKMRYCQSSCLSKFIVCLSCTWDLFTQNRVRDLDYLSQKFTNRSHCIESGENNLLAEHDTSTLMRKLCT